MRKILVTAFDPFGGDDKNSSMLVLEELPNEIGNIEITKLLVPTIYVKCAESAWKKAKETGAEAILCMGQAGGRKAVTPEKIAFNRAEAEIADNEGMLLNGVKLFEDGKDKYYSTLPVEKMSERATAAGFPSYVSEDAGLFVCNSLLYSILKRADDENSDIRCAFLHLPYASEQGKDAFSMEKGEIVKCVSEIIKAIF
jgi:pyroglutamyl-peptidase